MLKQTALKVAMSGALLTGIVASPFTVNFDRLTSYATSSEQVYVKPIDKLTFVSSNDLTGKIDKIKGLKDETLDTMKEKIKKNALNVKSIKHEKGKLNKNNKDLTEATEIAANVEDVKNDGELKAFLQTALQEGKMIYLYGSLTVQEYKELLNIKDLKLKKVDKDGKEYELSFGLSEEDKAELEKEKGPLKPGATLNNEQTNIVGFTLDKQKKVQFVDVTTGTIDETTGETIENNEAVFVSTIMTQQADNLEENEDATALISNNKASAANTWVKDNYGTDIYSELKNTSGTRLARVDMDWDLYQEKNDSDPNRDAFTLAPTTQANGYNGARAHYIWQDLDIPSDADDLETWTPKTDTAGAEITLSMAFPFSFSGSMTFSDSMDIDQQSSTGYDYARWVVTNYNLDDEVFEGAMGWKSSGTFAYVTYAGKVGVKFGTSYQYVGYTPDKRVVVSYDY